MQNDKLVSQLRLAADLLETGHPWEWQTPFGEWIKPTSKTELCHVISDGLLIRPILATPSDGRPLNNPDNLTAEQVGFGFRLILKEEVDLEYHKNSEFLPTHRLAQWEPGKWRWDTTSSIRLPLSVPWPETKPDPYAKAEKKTVPLGPEDVRCGDELDIEGKRFAILSVSTVGVEYWSHGIHQLTFKWLESNKIKIRRKNSNEWHLCNKLE